MNSALLSIVVSSCDKFKDCWEPFIHAFNQSWPDCPYEKYFISNHDALDHTNFHFIRVGTDRKWGDNLVSGLTHISSKYILYLQEDYWLSVPINTQFISEQLDYCERARLDYLRLTFPWMDSLQLDDVHALSPTEYPYGICLQAAIWRTDFLLSLIVPGMSGWDFEDMCNALGKTSHKTQVLLESVARKEFHYVDAVRKGRWTRIGYQYLKKEKMVPAIKTRQIEGALFTYATKFSNSPHRLVRVASKMLHKLLKTLHLNW